VVHPVLSRVAELSAFLTHPSLNPFGMNLMRSVICAYGTVIVFSPCFLLLYNGR
jgi:hypothetical protein